MNSEFIVVPNDEYDEILTQVMKMPAKKRTQFKYNLTDKWGQKSRVICRVEPNDQYSFWNYSLIAHKYCRITTYEQVFAADKISVDSPMAKHAERVIKIAIEREEATTGEKLNDEQLMELRCTAYNMVLHRWQELTHTGNHTGRVNHRVKIPQPGFPACL